MARDDAVRSKAQLRERLKNARRLIPRDERERVDAAIASRLLELAEYEAAPLVLTYLSFGSEVDTYAIVERAWAEGKDVALPRCAPKGRAMTWHVVTSFEGLERSAIGVLEPAPGIPELAPEDIPASALAIVPGLTFDLAGYRLGYGRGYYDTFLASFVGCPVGLCRIGQFTRDLRAAGVVEDHDLPVRMVVTEGGVLRV